jgi:hypothetical protein
MMTAAGEHSGMTQSYELADRLIQHVDNESVPTSPGANEAAPTIETRDDAGQLADRLFPPQDNIVPMQPLMPPDQGVLRPPVRRTGRVHKPVDKGRMSQEQREREANLRQQRAVEQERRLAERQQQAEQERQRAEAEQQRIDMEEQQQMRREGFAADSTLCRAYGIWDMSELPMWKPQILWVQGNMPALHSKLMGNMLEEQEFGIVATDDDDDATKQRRNELKVEYATRKYEVELETISISTCSICAKTAVSAGIFMEKVLRGPPTGTRKFYYMVKKDDEVLSYCYDSPHNIQRFQNTHHDHSYERLDGLCDNCKREIKECSKDGGNGAPKFSVLGGFEFGGPRPSCLEGLTLAEEALISPIQPVIYFLPFYC